jgi:hypothetical protein
MNQAQREDAPALVRIAGLESAFSFSTRFRACSSAFILINKYKGFVHVRLLGVKLSQMKI